MQYIVIFQIPILVEDEESPSDAMKKAADLVQISIPGLRPSIFCARIFEKNSNRLQEYFYNPESSNYYKFK